MAEIIDLTLSPPPEVIEISSDRENTPRRPNRTQENKRRQKKRRGTTLDGLATDGADSSARPSRGHSPEIGNRHGEPNEITARHEPGLPPLQAPPSAMNEPGLFVFDDAPVPIAVEDSPATVEPAESISDDNRLLLPSHVSIFHEDESLPTEILQPSKLSADDEEYIQYLDYEDRKAPGLVRYFEIEGEESNRSRASIFKCKNCGAEGDHKTFECPIQICLTCGARDEHSTRSCPIGKTCYTCGMKGHINRTCPNRFSDHMASSDLYGDCDRCGSAEHKLNECPTLWRIYQYVSDEERILIVQNREEKRSLVIGEGGEGYIGEELWCYNCADSGHLGDDCNEFPHPPHFPTEHSAFSSHNIMLGPFYDPAAEVAFTKRGPREQGNEVDWDAGPPIDVGKKGKNKDKEKLDKRFREQEDGGEDWFNDARKVRRKGMDYEVPSPSSRGKTFKFGLFKGGGYDLSSSPPSFPSGGGGPSLLERLGDTRGGKGRGKDDRGWDRQEQPLRIRGAASDGKHIDTRQARWEGSQDRRDRDRPGHRGSRRGHGPRYRGGYDR